VTAVSVTAEHIARGVPRSAFSCPVAYALEEAFPGTDCYAGRDNLTVYDSDSGGGLRMRVRVPHPDSVLKFIRAFDSDQPVEPFTFELDYPAATR
jgi:hypothetical protein